MKLAPGMAWLWPGLPQLWRRGSWSGLALGLAFAAVLNLAVVATFGWAEWPGAAEKGGVWLLVGLVWLGGLAWAWMEAKTERDVRTDSVALVDLYSAALDEYLQGNWVPAEDGLRAVLRRQPDDVAARLTLAVLLRRTRRLDESKQELSTLKTLEAATPWSMEIEREWSRVQQAQATTGIGTKAATTDSVGQPAAKTAASVEHPKPAAKAA